MNDKIVPDVFYGITSGFVECAVNALVDFFNKKCSVNNAEINNTGIQFYVDNYSKKQCSNLVSLIIFSYKSKMQIQAIQEMPIICYSNWFVELIFLKYYCYRNNNGLKIDN